METPGGSPRPRVKSSKTRRQKTEDRRHLPAGQAGKKAAIIVGHGSKMRGFQAAMEKVALNLRNRGAFDFVSCAYLEITPPSIERAIDSLARRGATKIFVLPYFLLMGVHIREDIPKIVKSVRRKYRSQVEIILCPYLGYHERIVSVVSQRLREGK